LLPSQCKKWVGKQALLRISDIRNRFRRVCFLQFDWLIFLGNYYHVGFKKGREAGLTLEGEVVALGRLTSISRWSKAKFK
jgi:hypothetical protein